MDNQNNDSKNSGTPENGKNKNFYNKRRHGNRYQGKKENAPDGGKTGSQDAVKAAQSASTAPEQKNISKPNPTSGDPVQKQNNSGAASEQRQNSFGSRNGRNRRRDRHPNNRNGNTAPGDNNSNNAGSANDNNAAKQPQTIKQPQNMGGAQNAQNQSGRGFNRNNNNGQSDRRRNRPEENKPQPGENRPAFDSKAEFQRPVQEVSAAIPFAQTGEDWFKQESYDPPISDVEYGKDCPFTDFSTAFNPAVNQDDEKAEGEKAENAEAEEFCTVIGVRFRLSTKVYFFDPDGIVYPSDSFAIVETARGTEYGYVVHGNRKIKLSYVVQPLRKAIRPATKADKEHFADNLRREEEAGKLWVGKVAEHGLDMKLIDVEYTFDNTKLLFFYTAEGRVDFRDLVKDLGSLFHCRIELRQMGIRDEAKIIGGLGMCGRPLCCAAFLPDFTQVSIKMAKEQTISLSASKISGTCGKLMCCLRYEHETYMDAISKTPPEGSLVSTPAGEGVVVEAKPLVELLKVRMNANPDAVPSVFRRNEITVLKKPGKRDEEN